jgi:uncharacterized protein YdaT
MCPWTAKTFLKHNKKLSPEKAKLAAEVANKVLARTGDEGRAIKEANAVVAGTTKRKKRY